MIKDTEDEEPNKHFELRRWAGRHLPQTPANLERVELSDSGWLELVP